MTAAPEHDDPSFATTADGVPRLLGGRYELGPTIGQGGSAQVHRAWDRRLHRAVAVKLFAPGVSGPDRLRQGQELRTLARLTHPGLVELQDAGRDGGQEFLVMQLVEGPSLADLVTRGPLPVPTVVGLGASLADALAYVHSAGVTHRDLKPDNVLLDEHGRPLLADFGIALLVDSTRVTVVGAVVGTAAYMAPEQVRGEPVGPAADVYSLGLVLLEALRGEREFPGTTTETVFARLHREPRIPDGLPGATAALLRGMTATDPADRPTAASAAAGLRSTAATLEAGTQPVTAATVGLGTAGTVPHLVASSAGPRPASLPTGSTGVGGTTPTAERSRSPRRRLAVAASVVGIVAAAGLGITAFSAGGGASLTGATTAPQVAAAAPLAVPSAPPAMPVVMSPVGMANETPRDPVEQADADPTPRAAGSAGSPGAAARPARTPAGTAAAAAEPRTAPGRARSADAPSGSTGTAPGAADPDAVRDDAPGTPTESPTRPSGTPSSGTPSSGTASAPRTKPAEAGGGSATSADETTTTPSGEPAE